MSVHHHTLDVRHTIEHHHLLFLLPVTFALRPACQRRTSPPSRRGLISGVASGLWPAYLP